MSDYFLADDLSGALDAAGGFHAAGARVRIVWTKQAWDAAPRDMVVGFTTETRNAAAAAAAAIVAQTLEHGKRRGARLCYKKIDSTLRGAVASELRAVLAALPQVRVLFTPANPRVGRTVRKGVLLVNGVPVAATEFGRDPANPVRESSIPALIGVSPGDRIEIVDAATEGDLAAAVEQMRASEGEFVAVGSGALARPVAAALVASGQLRAATSLTSEGSRGCRKGPRLIVCGSAHPANREQAAALSRRYGVAVCEVDIAAPDEAARSVVAALETHGGGALVLPAARIAPERALAAITTAGAAAIVRGGVTRMFVTGGETAFALCGRLGITYLDFVAELEAGLCLANTETSGGRLMLAVKPGGFGDARTWIRAWEALDGVSDSGPAASA